MDVTTEAHGREGGWVEDLYSVSVDLYTPRVVVYARTTTYTRHSYTRARASPPFPVDVNKLCSPTRTALLSGRYAYTNGMDDGVIIDGQGKSFLPRAP